MAFARNAQRIVIALLVIAATAVMVYFGNGLNPVWPLMWFAPLPVLWFGARSSWWEAAIAAFAAWMLGSLNMYRYFHLLGIPWFRVFTGVALVVTIGVLLFRLMVRRRAAWNALVAFPAVWVSFEYLLNRTTSGGTAGSVSYTQLHFLPFLQLASITGPWGMSFVMLLFSSAVAVWVHLRSSDRGPARRVVIATLSLIGAVLIFGAVRLSQPAPGQKESVGLIASDQAGNVDTASAGSDAERLLRAYAGVVQELAAKGAEIVVLPEKIAVAAGPDAASLDGMLQSLADKTGATIVAGLVHIVAPDQYNEARVYTPGAAPLSYDKEHMLPPFESNLKPGVSRTLLHKSSATWGVAICKDMDFAQPSRSYGEADTGLMLVPAWDFNLDRSWHGHIAIMRGVEDGFSLVRVAKDGYLTVSDDRGRIVAETRSDAAPFATLIASVPTVHDDTLYLEWGDWFAWLTIAMLVMTAARALFLRGATSARG